MGKEDLSELRRRYLEAQEAARQREIRMELERREEEKRRIEEEKKEKQRVKENIRLIKSELLGFMGEVNHETFQGRGRVSGWLLYDKRWSRYYPGGTSLDGPYDASTVYYNQKWEELKLVGIKGYEYGYNIVYGKVWGKVGFRQLRYADNVLALYGSSFSFSEYLNGNGQEIVKKAKQDLIDAIKITTERWSR
ncbi:MAG: hypothetical protein UX35_C0020G0007 [Microgenomates group bacterium GW2011_GWA1_46_15]|nr:MAG: hypothetical protein UX35_C0020G0007 [Microgenomates group bacterium GW2011_GWA1_46_15]